MPARWASQLKLCTTHCRPAAPMRDAISFTILIVVLLVRPTGIFGEPEKEKA